MTGDLTAPEASVTSPLDVDRVRKDFPILDRRVRNGHPLVYLDSANTSQKPQPVIDTLVDFYERHNANVARAMHLLGEEATARYEGARDKVAAFVGAPRDEIVFTKNASEALNLVANVLAWARPPLGVGDGDEVVITEMEHHSNIVPWQLLCERTGARLRWFGITDEGRLDLSAIDDLITERTKVVSLVYVSNILGTVNPVAEIARRAKQVGALVVVDGSQAAPQLPLDVGELAAAGVDFLAFTGHKMCGPSGIGVLWGRGELLAALPPFLGGGEMIETVRMTGTTYAAPPHRFEAGTPPIAPAIGLGAAVDYLTGLGMANVAAHERAITAYALERLQEVDGLTVIGPATPEGRGGAISFTLGDLHPHDVGQVLDELGIAVRVGHHCARPACERFGVVATTRASFYVYTTPAEVDALVEGLEQVKRFFRAGAG
jgi:cysteine desulfurase/selenocysteine lyase